MASAILLPGMLVGVGAGVLVVDSAPRMAELAPALFGVGLLLVLTSRVTGRVGPTIFLLGIVAMGLGVGAWRGAATALPVGTGSLAAEIGPASRQLTGTLTDEPRPRGTRQQAVLDHVAVVGSDGPPREVAGRLLVWLPRSVTVAVGDQIRLESRLEEPRDFAGFAYREYLARQGISAIASTRRAGLVAHQLAPLPQLMATSRRALLDGLQSLVPEPEAALAAGILMGVRSSISPEVSDAFATAGLTHVVAISGWNIAIVAALVAAAIRPLARRRGGRPLAVVVSGMAIGSYVLLTGASPSVVRAALMAGALVLARLGGSRAHAISALMLAALLMLLVAPPVLWDVGFQLSALATAGLIWFGSGIEARLRGWPPLVREPVALTLAAQLTTLPVILLNFERLSLIAPLANVLVVPLVPVVMLMTATAAVVGVLLETFRPPFVGDLLGWAAGGGCWLYLRAMIEIGQLAASVPLAAVDVTVPPWFSLGWYASLPAVRRWLGHAPPRPAHSAPERPSLVARLARPAPIALVSAGLLLALTVATLPDGRLRLVMLDIGQGDAILVRAPSGATLLVDGGPDPELAMRRLGEELPFWQRDLDVVLLTHPHEDHVAGLVPVLERYRVRLILDSSRPYPNPSYARFLADAAAEPSGRLIGARAGMRIPLDAGTSLRILFPTDADLASALPDGDINNASVVSVVEFGGLRILLTGDAEAPVERLLAERGLLERVQVLKVGHHGSNSSTTEPFLAAAAPAVALISAGIDNDYGHPHAVTLEKLAAIPGLVVHRTDLEGTIHLAWDRPPDTGRPAAGSIGSWPYPIVSAQRRSSAATSCRRGSWSIRAVSPVSRQRLRDSWWRRGLRWMWHSSRPPPCCMTSTRCACAPPARSMALSPRAGSPSWATRSWPFRSHHTRSRACSTTPGSRSAGHRSSSRWRIDTSRRCTSTPTPGSTRWPSDTLNTATSWTPRDDRRTRSSVSWPRSPACPGRTSMLACGQHGRQARERAAPAGARGRRIRDRPRARRIRPQHRSG